MPSDKDTYLGKGHQIKYSEEGFYLKNWPWVLTALEKKMGIYQDLPHPLQIKCVKLDRAKSW